MSAAISPRRQYRAATFQIRHFQDTNDLSSAPNNWKSDQSKKVELTWYLIWFEFL